MSRGDDRILTRVLTLVVAGLLTAVAARYVHRWLDTAEQKFFGYQPDPEGVAEFLIELGPGRYFSDAAPEAMAKSARIDTFLYRAMDAAHRSRYGKPFVAWKQGIGDCVSFGAGGAVYCSEAISWSLGKSPEAPLVPSTEAIYGGSRVEARGRDGGGSSPVGGWSDGSYGGAAAKWLRDWGVVYRQPFPELGYDLTNYSSDRAKNWGGIRCGWRGRQGTARQARQATPGQARGRRSHLGRVRCRPDLWVPCDHRKLAGLCQSHRRVGRACPIWHVDAPDVPGRDSFQGELAGGRAGS